MRFGNGRALMTLAVFVLVFALAIQSHSSLIGSIVQGIGWFALAGLSTAKLFAIWARRGDPARRAAATSAFSLAFMPSRLRKWILDESAVAGPTRD